MWFALRGMDFNKIAGYFAKANYLWVLIAAAFGLLAYWFRAVRWNLLLEPMGYQISNANAFWTISFGYLMNLTIPRSGELARSTALYGVEGVPVDKSFGTIILERVVDLICMVAFLGLTLIFKYDAILAFYRYATDQKSTADEPKSNVLLFSILGLFVLAMVFYFAFKNQLRKFAIIQKILAFGNGILDGLKSIFQLKQKGKFLLLTVGIWISYYFAAYLICFSLPETSDFTFADGFFIILVGTLGMMVPASGGIGAFHFALKLGIMALFLSMGKNPEVGGEVGLSYAFISHTMQLVLMIVFGFLAIPILAKSRSKYLEK